MVSVERLGPKVGESINIQKIDGLTNRGSFDISDINLQMRVRKTMGYTLTILWNV